MRYRFQKLTADDRRLARQLLRAWWADEGIADPELLDDEHLDRLLANPFFHAYVALAESTVVGGLTAYELPLFDANANEMFLYEIGVAQAHRQQGVARRLIDALRQTCREKGINVIFVGTSMDNGAARSLYERTGGELEIIPWYTYDLSRAPGDENDH